MKKVLFLFLLVLSCTSIYSQTKWEYPVKPGSDKWKGFITHAEMVDACKIPDTVLEKMVTIELLEAWESFPLKYDVIAFNTPQQGFEVQKKISSALRLLLSKEDAGEVVLKRYKEAKAAEKQIFSEQHPKISSLDYWLLKILLSQPEVKSKINDVNNKLFIENELKSAKSLKKIGSSLNIYTPRSTPVPNTIRSDGADDPWEQYVFNIQRVDSIYRTNYPQATLLSSSTRTYNCHSYAWANGYTNRCWINSPSDDLYFQEPAGDGSYDNVSESVSAKVSYSGDHSATTTSTPNVYISKWGAAPLMQHSKNYVPSIYSSPSYFWKRSVDVPQDQPSIASALSAAVSGQTINVTGSQSLSGNLSVQSGVTLVFNSGSSLNPYGFSVVSTGGTITVQSGAYVVCAFLKNSNGTIKGLYPTVQSALNSASSGQTVELSVASTLQGNASVPSGITLTIYANLNLASMGYYIVSTGGTINIQSSVLCSYLKQSGAIKGYFPTIQSAINYASSGQTVELQARTYNESSVSMKSYIPINGAGISSSTINGSVVFSYANQASLTNMTITGMIQDQFGSYNLINAVKVQNLISIGWNNYSQVKNCEMITSTNYGIVAGYSMIDVVENGHIKNKAVAGLSGSNVDMTCAFVVFCNNTNNNGKDVISAMSADDIYLHGCGFSSPIAGSTVSGPGHIYWDFWTSCSGLPKNTTANEILTGNDDPPSSLEIFSEEKKLAGRDDYKKAMDNYRSIRENMYKENESRIIDFKKYEMEIDNIVSQFRAIIKSYPGSVSSLKSFQNILGCYDILQEQHLGKQIAEELLSDKDHIDVRSHIKLRSLPLLIEEQDYDGALRLCDEVIHDMPNTSEAAFLLYNKGFVYEVFKNDIENAKNAYEELIKQYPNTMYAYLADKSLGKESIPQKSTGARKIETLELDNFPNPFNPETKIKYNIPTDGFVTLKIFDVLGREVKILVNEQKSKGEYSVNFDASDLVSGMYLYQLRIDGQVMVKKMILLK